MSSNRLLYLACPYSHKDEDVWQERRITATRVAGDLMIAGHIVFSPLTHTCGVADIHGETATDWLRQDLEILQRCDALVILPLEGHQLSVGVQREIAAAKGAGLPIVTMFLDGDGRWSLPCDFSALVSRKKGQGGDPKYLAILDEMRALHIRKSTDYGSDTDAMANLRVSAQCGVEPAHGAWVRTLDKVTRINQYWRRRSLANETVEDSYMDLAAYVLLGLCLLREAQSPGKDEK
jgi:hypothetical protein